MLFPKKEYVCSFVRAFIPVLFLLVFLKLGHKLNCRDSEDTILFILKEIYTNLGIAADNPASIAAANEDLAASTLDNLPSPSQSTFDVAEATPSGIIDPTMPINMSSPIQPPPTFGFVRK